MRDGQFDWLKIAAVCRHPATAKILFYDFRKHPGHER